MGTLPFSELRFAIRRLCKDAGSTIASVAALACAIGAAVATWSLLSSVLLQPLSIETERLFMVDEPPPPAASLLWVPTESYPVFESFRNSGAFEAIAAGGLQQMLVVEQGEVPQSRQVYFADHAFFATLGINAASGRTFKEDEDRRGAPAVAVLSDHYWRTVFSGDPGVLGRTVTVSGTAATIIGILPRGFRGLHLSEAPELYLPLQVSGDIDHQLFKTPGLNPLTEMGWIRIVGRLRPGETPAAVEARLNAMDSMSPRGLTMRDVGPLSLTDVSTAAIPRATRGATAHFATLLSITVGLLLLVGCLTVGMLLLVRTEDRRDELAVRLALGATRSRLALGLAVEAAMLSALGAVLAVPVALCVFYGVRGFQLPGNIAVQRLELALAPGAWLAIASAALAATGAIALLASFVGAATAGRSPIQPRALATPRVTRRAPRTMLVAGQIAITLVLVTGAGLFTRSLIEALSLNPAIETSRIATAFINLAQYGYTPERAAAFVDELRERLGNNSVVASVSIRQAIWGATPGVRITVDGAPRELPSGLGYMAIDEDYFSTIGLPIINGRSFARSDSTDSSAAIVSESLARFIADGGNPLGRRINDSASFPQIFRGEAPATTLEIIGVVPDLVVSVNATQPFEVYQPAARGLGGYTLVLRAAGDSGAAIREAMSTARELDARVTLQNLTTLDEQIGRQMNPQRFGIYVLGTLGGIALLLTVLGTYVIAQSMVVRRRRELGIRAALGAGSAQLRRLVLRDTARLVGIGLVAGLALAVAGARLIRSLLYQVEPLDPVTLGTTAFVIFGLALLVSLRPALEATRVDLNRTLREE